MIFSVAELRAVKRGSLADKLEENCHALADANKGKIKKATLSQTAVTLGIHVDKVQVLRKI